jgi:hypothetical protein
MRIFGWVMGILLILGTLSLIGRACTWTSGALDTAQHEVSAKELLRKYQWFKDASAELDKKLADIKVYEKRVGLIEKKKNPTRADQEQMYVWMSEVAGVKASYNGLASSYNSQMSKINWAFTNVGDLPKGATGILPREYKPYIED